MRAAIAAAWLTAAGIGVVAPTAAWSDTASEAALRAIDECRARLDPRVDIGYERIVRRCPELPRLLGESELAAWLPESWRDSGNDLSAGSLEELHVLATRELARESTGQAPRVERLGEVLTEIGQTAQRRGSLWSRFKTWLRRVLADRNGPEDAGWFARTVGRVGLSQTVIELITYAALAAVLALAAVIVTNELRVAGVLSRGRARFAARASPSEVPQTARLGWRDFELAPPGEKPRVLLELIIDRLAQARCLPPAQSLTVRELVRAAELHASEDRHRLQRLALAAEQLRYSADRSPPEGLQAALEDARALLERLESQVMQAGR